MEICQYHLEADIFYWPNKLRLGCIILPRLTAADGKSCIKEMPRFRMDLD